MTYLLLESFCSSCMQEIPLLKRQVQTIPIINLSVKKIIVHSGKHILEIEAITSFLKPLETFLLKWWLPSLRKDQLFNKLLLIIG